MSTGVAGKEGLKAHIKLAKNERYRNVIVCGAPERAARIASRLSQVEAVAKNREYHSYLGKFKERDILVTSHGVGAAGATICFQELMDVGAQNIVRLGTAGGLRDDSHIGEILIATAAVRKDGVSRLMIPEAFPAIPDMALTQLLLSIYKEKGIPVRSGILVSTDLFYPGLLDPELELYKRANAVGVEMECSALFITAALRGVRAAAVAVSDGNPLKWKEGDYDPQSNRLQESVEKSIDVCLEMLSRAAEAPQS